MSDDPKRRAVSRRGFLAAGAGGAAAGIGGTALAQDFIDLGPLDDLDFDWWTDDTPTDPPVDPDPPGPGLPPVDETSGTIIRRNIFSLDPNGPEIAALRRGVRVMRSRGPDDPTSWTYQARIHGVSRGGASVPFGAPWGTCRHASNDFLSWHRLYLHYFERILRAASGDPAFALPYWDYSIPGQNLLPPAFRRTFGEANPLYEPRRNPGINAGDRIDLDIGSGAQAMRTLRFSRPFFTAALENQPHNIIHVEIGGAMGDPVTAGEDPIFWLHHANIDRLWSRWIASGNGRANPTDPAFLGAPFPFADETGRIVTARGGDAVDPEGSLGYRYDDDIPSFPGGDTSLVFASAEPRPAPAPVAMAAMAASPMPRLRDEPAPFQVAANTLAEGDGLRLDGKPSGTRLAPERRIPAITVPAMPAPSFDPSGAPEPMVLSEPAPLVIPTSPRAFLSAEGEEPVLLQLEDIEFDVPPGIWYAIYVNKPEDAPANRRGPYFAGIFAPFAQNQSDEPTTFDISGLLNRQIEAGLWGGGEIDVEFIPSREDPDIPPIDIGRIRIVRR